MIAYSLAVLFSCLLNADAQPQEQTANQQPNGRTLISVSQATQDLGWKFNRSPSGNLLILCQETDTGICVPVQLSDVEHRIDGGDLLVDATVLADAMGAQIVVRDGATRLKPSLDINALKEPVTAYHEDWGENRGFRVGQTVPDIPLYDMSGNEVRFSQFLGRQYIIYSWASW